MPTLFSGSADLYGSTKNYIKGADDFMPETQGGRNVWFGIREHAMGAILNGAGYDGIFRPSGATFAVFADYLRAEHPARRSNKTTSRLHLHPRLGRRRGGRADPPAGRDL